MNLSLLIEKWEKKKTQCSAEQALVYEDCIRDVTMMISGEMKTEYHLDSPCPFKKFDGKNIAEAIKQEPGFFSWAIAKVVWFALDEPAFNFLIEMGG